MTQHAFDELNFLKLRILKKLKINQIKNIFLINKKKKNSLKLKKYFFSKNQKFFKFLIEKNSWFSYSEFLINFVFIWDKIGGLRKISNEENLENFLKNFPIKFLKKISKLCFEIFQSKVSKDFSIERIIFFHCSFKESKGKIRKKNFLEKNNENQPFFLTITPENFQIYLEQIRINIDHKNFPTAGVIINDKIKDTFSTLSLKKSRLCFFEQIIRNLIKINFKNLQICKLYSVRFKEIEREKPKGLHSTVEFFFIFFYFLVQKNHKKDSFLFRIIFSEAIIKKIKLINQFLIILSSGQLIIWSKFKVRLIRILNKDLQISKNLVFRLLRKIRAEIILNNIKVLSSSFKTVLIINLNEILEVDLIDLQFWLQYISKYFKKNFLLDRLTGKCYFNYK
ncbi:hypothetical protein HAN_2g268 (nucleomorph) [Hemiselmis andersenii]|uniref:Uncharacterized protein n=1 Tax=Hemiselmis andersenii TaxID=464988 RepID=A9BKT7_HEMAN|nr:hypothetical protein HAN_2g268 [Hemiselmis andersenii]ABW98092.1 hypothetical protein HAN_2g268 [Hemiselmis andersenii]